MKNDGLSENGQVTQQSNEIQGNAGTSQVTETSQTTGASQTNEAPVRTLFSKEIRPIRNWCEWLSRWNNAGSYQEMLGLIHFGFNVRLERYRGDAREYRDIDRVEFYLKLIDGWQDPFLLMCPDDNGIEFEMGYDARGNLIRVTPSELRHAIANKALESLCQKFFTEPLLVDGEFKKEFSYQWCNVITKEPIFSLIQNLFRSEDSVFGNSFVIRNLPLGVILSHKEKILREFLFNIARFLWGWKGPKVGLWMNEEQRKTVENEKTRIQGSLDAAKPWMIEVLSFTNNLPLLKQWMSSFDTACVNKLKEIAYRTKLTNYSHPVKVDRLVKSVDEACLAGSPAACLLKDYELYVRVRGNLSELLELEREAEAAKSRLEELKAKDDKP
jgi:hypothetical protein